jgi:hypothetical protein
VKHIEFASTNPEAHVLQAEKVIALVPWSTQVFARAKQKVETHHQTVSGAERQSGANFASQADRHMNELQRQWFDAGGGGVGLFPSIEKGREAKVDVAKLVQARVRGPQPGKRLPHTS